MRIAYIFLVIGLLGGCKEKSVVTIVKHEFLKEALSEGGGYDAWSKITELSFTKKTEMFLPDSTVEVENLQRQTFRNYPTFYGEIQYLNDSLERRIVQKENEVLYFEKGVQINDEVKVQKAATSIQIAYYVIGLPFKLMDEGAKVMSVDDEKLMDGRSMKSMHVVHDSDPDQNWWVYFHPEDKLMSGYLIEHDGRYSYILNDEVTTVKGFTFPLGRRSMSMDLNRENKYLRAQYEYSDYKIALDN